MDTNTYYTCKCVYFDGGFITCKICQKWINESRESKPKVEPVIFAKRWTRNHGFNQKSKKIFSTKYIDSTDTNTKINKSVDDRNGQEIH